MRLSTLLYLFAILWVIVAGTEAMAGTHIVIPVITVFTAGAFAGAGITQRYHE